MQGKLFAGLSGIQLPIPKYRFPPEFEHASRLTYYASFFNSIEINSSFYKIPRSATIVRWCQSVPDGFRFTFKLFKEITHCGELNFQPETVRHFFDAIAVASEKSGCVLVQFPPGLTENNFPQLNHLLEEVSICNRDHQWKIAVEFRSRGWYNDHVYDLLDHYNAALVMHDMPRSAPPRRDSQGKWRYIRFHGPTGNYRGSYPEEFLDEYAAYVMESIEEGSEIFLYFNNTAGDAFQNLVSFNEKFHTNRQV